MPHLGTQTLTTPRLILQRHQAADAEMIFRNWASDPAAARFWSWDAHRSIAETRTILAQWIDSYCDPEYYHWSIVHQSLGEPIGFIYLEFPPQPDGSASVHYLIARRYWNQGYATEACRCVTQHAFHSIGLRALCSWHHAENPASGRVLGKCGFTYSHSCQHCLSPERISGTYRYYRMEKR